MLQARVMAIVLVAGVLAGPAVSAIQPDPLAPTIAAIAAAQDPSAVVELYAHGLRIDSNSKSLRKAYIRQMAYLGMPQTAYVQARKLVESDPADGLAWAVIADAAARLDMIPGALWSMAKAVQHTPTDEFVIATAAQVLGWYDSLKPVRGMAPLIEIDAEKARAVLARNELYKQVYAQAAAGFKVEKELASRAAARQPADEIKWPEPEPAAAPVTQVVEQTTVVNNYYEDDRGWVGGHNVVVVDGRHCRDREEHGYHSPRRAKFTTGPLPLKPAFAEPREWHGYRFVPNHLGGDKPVQVVAVTSSSTPSSVPVPRQPISVRPKSTVRSTPAARLSTLRAPSPSGRRTTGRTSRPTLSAPVRVSFAPKVSVSPKPVAVSSPTAAPLPTKTTKTSGSRTVSGTSSRTVYPTRTRTARPVMRRTTLPATSLLIRRSVGTSTTTGQPK